MYVNMYVMCVCKTCYVRFSAYVCYVFMCVCMRSVYVSMGVCSVFVCVRVYVLVCMYAM